MSKATLADPGSRLDLPSCARKTRVVIHLWDLDHGEPIVSRRITLQEPMWSVEIGRGSTSDHTLTPASSNGWFTSRVMSRHHAILRADPLDRLVTVEDNDSMHGTRMKGNRLHKGQREPLSQQEIIEFGQHVFRGHEKYPPLRLRVSYEWASSTDQREPEKASCTNKFTADYSDEEDLSGDDEGEEILQKGLPTHTPRLTSHLRFSNKYSPRASDHDENGDILIEMDDDAYSPEPSLDSVNSPLLRPSSRTDRSDNLITPDIDASSLKEPTEVLSHSPRDASNRPQNWNAVEPHYSSYYRVGSEDGIFDNGNEHEVAATDGLGRGSDPSLQGSEWEESLAPLTSHQIYLDKSTTDHPWTVLRPLMPQSPPPLYTRPSQYSTLSTDAVGYVNSGGLPSCARRPTTSYGLGNVSVTHSRSLVPAACRRATAEHAPVHQMSSHDSASSTHGTSVSRPEILGINSILNDDTELQTRLLGVKERQIHHDRPASISNKDNFRVTETRTQDPPALPGSRSSSFQPYQLPNIKPSKVVALDLTGSSKKRTFDDFSSRESSTPGSKLGAQASEASGFLASTLLPKQFLSSHPSTEDALAVSKLKRTALITEREGPVVKKPKTSSKTKPEESESSLSTVAKYTATAAAGMALGALGTVYGLAALPLDYFA